MSKLSLVTATDVQDKLATTVRRLRKQKKLSRRLLAERSTVPESTIKKFETSGQISLRQFILLWQCVDELSRLDGLCRIPEPVPRSIDEVLGR